MVQAIGYKLLMVLAKYKLDTIKFFSQKSSFVRKHDSARKLKGFLLLSDFAFPRANQMAEKGHCERKIPPSGFQALGHFLIIRISNHSHELV